MKIILASQSPRRAELLRKIFPKFDIIPSHFDEAKIKEKNPVKYVQKAACAKAEKAAEKIKEEGLIIAADTIIVFKGKIIGKPKDDKDSFRILSKLIGKKQEAITGFCLLNTKTGEKIVDFEKSVVKMHQISSKELLAYIATGEGKDKAGGYAIQEKGEKFIEYVKGDFYNVMGFPVNKIKKCVKKIFPEYNKKKYGKI